MVVNGESKFYTHGESVTVTAEEKEGKVFKGWQDESGKIVSTEKEYTFEVLDAIETETGRYLADFRSSGLQSGKNRLPISLAQSKKFPKTGNRKNAGKQIFGTQRQGKESKNKMKRRRNYG